MATKFNMLISAKTQGANDIKKLGNSMQGVQGKVKNLKMSVGNLSQAFKVLAGVIAAGAFTRFIKSSIDTADSFDKLSRRTGVAANTLMAYVDAGRLADVSQEQIGKGLLMLSRTMNEASQGVATYKDAYDELGITVTKSDGSLKQSDTVLSEIAEKFKTMPDGPKKAALAMDLFGKSGAQLITLLNGGTEALTQFNYETSENFAANAAYFNDQIAILANNFGGFRRQLTDALLPALNAILEAFSEVLGSDQDFKGFFKFMEVGIKGIASVVLATVQSFRFFGRVIQDLVKIAGHVGRGQFGKAGEVMTTGLADTREQFRKDMEAQMKVWFGASSAPSSYISQPLKQIDIPDFQEGVTRPIKEARAELEKTAITVEKVESGLNDAFGESSKITVEQFGYSIQGVKASMQDVVVNGLKSMEDALVDFVTTGEFNFRNFANSIIREMARIAIQQAIMKSIGGFFGGLFGFEKGGAFAQNGIQKFARGGVIKQPTMFRYGGSNLGIAGEAGPEAIMPLKRGRGGRLGVEAQGGGNTNISISVDASGSSVEGQGEQARQLGQAISLAVQSELVKQKQPGGLLN
jgi:hypothetical protein